MRWNSTRKYCHMKSIRITTTSPAFLFLGLTLLCAQVLYLRNMRSTRITCYTASGNTFAVDISWRTNCLLFSGSDIHGWKWLMSLTLGLAPSSHLLVLSSGIHRTAKRFIWTNGSEWPRTWICRYTAAVCNSSRVNCRYRIEYWRFHVRCPPAVHHQPIPRWHCRTKDSLRNIVGGPYFHQIQWDFPPVHRSIVLCRGFAKWLPGHGKCMGWLGGCLRERNLPGAWMGVDWEIHHANGGIIGQFIYYLILLVL